MTFTASVTSNGPNNGVSWFVNNIAGGNSSVGTITTGGAYTAPATVPAAGSVTIKAQSLSDATKTASATVTLVTVTPVITTVAPTQINTGLAFSLVITGTGFNADATASLNDGTVLTVASRSSTSLTLTGTSASAAGSQILLTVVNPTPAAVKSAARSITVIAPISVTLTPETQTLHSTEVKTFSAAITNSSDKAVNWQVNGIDGGNATVGTIVAGKYTAPSGVPAGGSVTVKAISHADPGKSDTSVVTLLNPVPVIQSLSTTHINTQLAFKLTIKGTNFNTNAAAILDDGTILNVTNRSATQLDVTGTSSTAAGKTLQLTVINPAPGATTSTARTISVDPPVTINVTPDTATVRAGSARDFNASIGNNSDQTVIWKINGKAGGDSTTGTIDSNGLYTAPLVIPAAAIAVSATSNADPSKSDTSAVTLQNALPVVTLATTPIKAGPAVTVTVIGTGFAKGAAVILGSSNLTVTFVDSTKLTATGSVSPPVGGILPLTLINPDPGAATSNVVPVTVNNAGTKATYLEAKRLLEQATWGPTPESIAHVMDIGASAWLDEQFDTSKSPISQYSLPIDDSTNLSPLQLQFFKNAVAGADQLRQRVAFALSQIVVVSENKLPAYAQMMPYQQLLLNDAFGTYHQVLKDVTLSPAMGHFLDMVNNDKPSAKASPDENYARELMQLFTLGLAKLTPGGVPTAAATYSEADVAALARVFTGWTYPGCFGTSKWVNQPCFSSNMVLFQAHHDADPKLVLGSTINNTTGDADLDQALNLIEHYPSTDPTIPNIAPFIALRLIQHLVTGNPSPTYVQNVAAKYAATGGNLKEVVRAILTDPEAGYGNGGADLPPGAGHLREPALYAVALLRALGATYVLDPPLNDSTTSMGQDIFNAPSVFNYYSPSYRIAGINSPEFQILSEATAFARSSFAYKALHNQISRNIIVDLSGFRSLAADKNTATQTASLTVLLNAVSQALLGKPMSGGMLSAVLPAMTATTDASTRAANALFLVAVSAQYQVQR